jgi:hypothetical protein
MKTLKNCTTRWLTSLFFILISIIELNAEAQTQLPVLKSDQKPAKGWSLIQSDLQGIELGYRYRPVSSASTFSEETVYIGLFPQGTPKLTLKDGLFLSYDTEGIFRGRVSTDSVQSINVNEPLVRVEPVGWIRDWRVGRLIIKNRRETPEQTFRLDSTFIRLTPGEMSPSEIDTIAQPGNSKGRGLDKILGDLLLNYQPESPLRALPALSRSFYPGLPGPNFLDKKTPWIRVDVSTTGLYRIPFSELATAKFKATKTFPRFMLYKRGILQPVEVISSGTKSGAEEGYLVFYHQQENNPYSDNQAYWLSWDVKSPGSVTLAPETLSHSTVAEPAAISFSLLQQKRLVFEEDNLNDPAVSLRDNETREPWFWKAFSVKSSGAVKIELKGTDNLQTVNTSIPVEIVLAGKSAEAKVLSHKVIITWDAQTIGQAQWSGASFFTVNASISPDQLKSGFHKLGFILPGTSPASAEDEIYLDSISLNVKQPLQYEGIPLEIIPGNVEPRQMDYIAVSGITTEQLANSLYLFAADTMGMLKKVTFQYKQAEKAIVFPVFPEVQTYYLGSAEDGIESAEIKAASITNDLRALDNQADYILIYHPDFLKAAQTLAKYRAKQGMTVKLVNVMDIYDQFNYGDFNPQAIRDFLRYTLYYWQRPYPAYVLLMGDGTSDYKGRNKNGVINYIPPYRTKVMSDDDATDLWYVQLTGKDAFPDMEIGRISVNNPTDADAVVEKTIQYETSPLRGPWRNRILFVSDDGFEEDCWNMADLLPNRYFQKFINLRHYPYVDNYYLPPGEDSKISPEANQAIMDAISEGDLAVVYYGHGSPNVWGHERMLFGGDSKNSDMKKLTNGRKLPFVFNLTCSMGQFDWPTRPWNICITEDMHRVLNGGAVSLYEPSGKGFTPQHRQLNQRVFQALFTNEQWIHGDAITESVISYFLNPGLENLPLMYILFSDPALRLQAPDKEISIETSPGNLVSRESTTIHISCDILPFKEGTVTLEIGKKKEEYEPELAPEDAGCFSGITSFTLPVKNGKFTLDFLIKPLGNPAFIPVRVYGMDKKGQVDASGYSLLTVDQYRLEAKIVESTFDKGIATIWAEIENPGLVDLPGLIGEFKIDNISVSAMTVGGFPAGQKVSPTFQFPVPPGVHTLTAMAGTPDGYSLLTINHTLLNPEVPPSYPSLAVTPGEITFDPPVPIQGKNLDIQVVIHNLDRVSQDSVKVDLVTDGKQVVYTQNIVSLPAQSACTTTFKWMPSRGTDSTNLSLLISGDTVWSKLVAPLKLADPAISDKDVIMSKAGYLDGETLFATITVHNLGDLPAEDVQIVAYDGDPNVGAGKQLMDRTDWRIPTLPAIAPHSYRVVRERMDTLNNAGDRKIYFYVNRFSRMQEWDSNNNKAIIPVHIYSKPQLAIVKTEWIKDTTHTLPGYSRKVLLQAIITNKGETTAEDVVVQFYNHNVKIGNDLLIPSIKYKEEKKVETYWDIPLGKHNVHVEVGLKSHFDRASNAVLGLDGN